MAAYFSFWFEELLEVLTGELLQRVVAELIARSSTDRMPEMAGGHTCWRGGSAKTTQRVTAPSRHCSFHAHLAQLEIPPREEFPGSKATFSIPKVAL